MMPGARRSFWLALVVSALIHLGVLMTPGWGLPDLDEEPASDLIEARLAPIPSSTPTLVPPNPPPALPKSSPPPHKSMPAPPAVSSPAAVTDQPEAVAPPPQPDAVSPVPEKGSPSVTPTFEPVATEVPAFVPVAAMANRWPRDGRMVFQVTRGEGGLIVGESTHIWQHDGESYRLQAVTETVGLAALFRPARVEQISEGGFDAYGLRPHRFEAMRDGKRRESVRFDVAQGQVFLGNGQASRLLPGTQDLLALFHQLGAHSDDQGDVILNIATGRKMAAFRITLVGAAMVETPYREFRTRHYSITGDKSDDATEVWIDQQSHLPVKIRHRDRKGEVFDQIVTKIELKEAP